jgi:hypothetical protein
MKRSIMTRHLRQTGFVCTLLALMGPVAAGDEPVAFRPPSVPLVAHDPYFSIWSSADELTGTTTTHWTGKPHPLIGLLRVDGKVYRVLGAAPEDVPALPQRSLRVLSTRTIYEFGNEQVHLRLTFLSPALPADLDRLARPVTYVCWEVSTANGRPHAIAAYFEASPLIGVDTPDQEVAWGRVAMPPWLETVRVGSKDQRVLARQGDDLRIDWGWLYLTAVHEGHVMVASAEKARAAFARGEPIPGSPDNSSGTQAVSAPALVAHVDFGPAVRATVQGHFLIAYDDEWSIRYFDENLRPYWRRGGWDAVRLLTEAENDYSGDLVQTCIRFDDDLRQTLTQLGGADYARLGALAFRQTLAGCKLAADRAGQPLWFPKENHSNGCISTVDVIYPMGPFPLAFSTALTKALLIPVLDYAASDRWKFAYAPHDLGRYPHATGQVYGGGERTDENQMMVEESANMLLLVYALTLAEGNAEFAGLYRGLLEKWAVYLSTKGFDPENQLCTDDFAGHLAHNVNLSAKAIVALGAYSRLCATLGADRESAKYRDLARGFAAQWLKQADDGDHFRLAFDRPGSWSQKYNLVWDRLLGVGLFPPEAIAKEVDFYLRNQKKYGLPLDSRSTYTKLDWTVWTATLSDEPVAREALLAPVIAWVNATPDRSPLTDWYFTDTAKKRGFTARPVVGGVFLPMLGQERVWSSWVARGSKSAGPWAPIPIHRWTELSPTGVDAPISWFVRFDPPGDPNARSWTMPDALEGPGWQEQPAPFGQAGHAGYQTRTRWPGGELWMRREFRLPSDFTGLKSPRIRATCSGPTEVYLNGVLACQLPGGVNGYENVTIAPQALAALEPGRNVLAVHSRAPRSPQPGARVHVDAGLIELDPETPAH